MKIKTRTGKIARLPRGIREQLNRRLEDGEPGNRLAEWLNSLPEVQRVVATDFAGERVSESNLSRWRNGGYRDWLEQQESLESVQRMAEDGPELAAATKGELSDHTAVWLLARELAAFKRLREEEGGEEAHWQRLREFCDDLVRLRRGDQRSRRLAMEEERWERQKAAEEAEKAEDEPDDWELTPEERKDRINEIYGRPKGWRPEGDSQPGNQGNEGAGARSPEEVAGERENEEGRQGDGADEGEDDFSQPGNDGNEGAEARPPGEVSSTAREDARPTGASIAEGGGASRNPPMATQLLRVTNPRSGLCGEPPGELENEEGRQGAGADEGEDNFSQPRNDGNEDAGARPPEEVAGGGGQVTGERENEDGGSRMEEGRQGADEWAKDKLMGRDQVGLPARIWALHKGPCGRPPESGEF